MSNKFTETYKKRCVKKLIESGKGCEQFSKYDLNGAPTSSVLHKWAMQYASENEIPECYKIAMVIRYMNSRTSNVPEYRIEKWYKKYKNDELKVRSIGTDNYKNKKFLGVYKESYKRDFVNEFINQDSLNMNNFTKLKDVKRSTPYYWFQTSYGAYKPIDRYSTQSKLKLVSMHLERGMSLYEISVKKFVPISFLKQFLQEYKEGKLNNNHVKEEQMYINSNIDKSTRTLNIQLDNDTFKMLLGLSFMMDKNIEEYISLTIHEDLKKHMTQDLNHFMKKLD